MKATACGGVANDAEYNSATQPIRNLRDDPLSRRFVARLFGFRFGGGLRFLFVGRFFGPLRSIMPLAAGICGMRQLPFQIANLASAVIWATGVLAPGIVVMNWLL